MAHNARRGLYLLLDEGARERKRVGAVRHPHKLTAVGRFVGAMTAASEDSKGASLSSWTPGCAWRGALSFWRSPSHGERAPRVAGFRFKFTPGCPGPPSAPPAIELGMLAKQKVPSGDLGLGG
eukprot:1158782-Pelagomonas_calceolata.AAC.1